MQRVCAFWSLTSRGRLLAPVFTRSFAETASESISTAGDPSGPAQRLEMPFQDFVKLKRQLRTRKRLAGSPFAFAGLTGSSMFHAWLNPHMFDATSPDQLTLYFGIDPLVLAGISGVVCGGIGYIFGGMLIEAVWHLFTTQLSKQLKQREADFLARISKYRATTNSRYEDDYYGESVKTLSDYRQWLRRQQRIMEGKLTNVDVKPTGSASSFN